MSVKALFAAIASIATLTINVKAAEVPSIKISRTDTDAAIFKKHLELCNIQNPLNVEAYQEIAATNSLIMNCDFILKAIARGDDRQISYQTNQTANNLRYKKNSLTYKSKRIAELDKKLKALKTDKAKQAELAKLEAESKSTAAEIDKVNRPFTIKINKFLAKMNASEKSAELSALLRPLVTVETDINGKVTSKGFSADFKSAFISNNWHLNDKWLAWAHIRIKSMRYSGNTKKLAEKYPIQSISSNSIWFWVGKYQICFVVNDKKYQTQDKVKELAQKLLKLPELASSSNSKIVKDCLATAEFVEKIKKEQGKAARKLNTQKWKISREISALTKQGYQSPEAVAKLKSDYAKAKAEYAADQSSIAIFTELEKILKSPAPERKKAIPKLESKLAEMKQQIIAVCTKLKARKAGIISPADFDAANARFQALIGKIVRMPKSKEFAAVNQVSTDAWFGSPQTSTSWDLCLPSRNAYNRIPVFRGTLQPYTNHTGSEGMIDGKYVIYTHNDSSIIVGVGPWVVTLFSNSPLYGKDVLLKAVKELYDLDAIATLSK